MHARDLISYGIGVAILVAATLLLRRQLASRLEDARLVVAEAARELSGEPDSVPYSALNQRYRLRRAAVAAMRADLRRLVAAESAFVADSGHATAVLPTTYYRYDITAGNVGRPIQIRPGGWWATIVNVNTTISCVVFVGAVDTVIPGARPGEPTCAGVS